MELRHLRYFIRAAELLNFTKAAESLYVSQPTLSVQIHQLEEELGAELFARSGRTTRLTQSGQTFLVRALQAVRELEEGSKEIDAINGLLRGGLCIGSLPLYGSKLVSKWIADFITVHPQVSINMRSGPSEDIETGILAGTIDMGISFQPVQHPELTVQELLTDEIVLVVAKNHGIACKQALSLDDFQSLELAFPSERISAMRLVFRYFEELKIQPNVRLAFDDGHALLEFVKSGGYATCLPRRTVTNEPELCTFSLPGGGMPVTVAAMWTHLTPASKVFLQLMTEKAKQLPAV